MKTFEEKLQNFAETITTQQLARHAKEGLTYPGHENAAKTFIRPGKKYTKVDVGTSGKYMVDNATEEIFGIKAYGVIHRGHKYGTLDTIDDWNWGGYTAYLNKT